jgi:hypothetical protein
VAYRDVIRRLRPVAITAVALPIAALSLLNAASDIEMPLPGGLDSGPAGGLTSVTAGRDVDRTFRMLAAQSTASRDGSFPAISPATRKKALRVFAVEPLDAAMLRTLALGYFAHQATSQARLIARTADRISSRDDVNELWLAVDYGKHDDVANALSSFDKLLRTAPRYREVAMTPVVETLALPSNAKLIGNLLSSNPEWERQFWDTLVTNPVGIDNVANLLAANNMPFSRIPEADRSVLFGNLRKRNRFAELQRLARLDPTRQTSEEKLSAGRFVTADKGYPFGWTTYASGDAAAQAPDQSGLTIEARPGTFGTAADRIVPLSGRYRLSIAMARPVPDNARLELAATCLGKNGTRTGTIAVSGGSDGGAMDLPWPDCSFAKLTLSFTVDAGRDGAVMNVASVKLTPL